MLTPGKRLDNYEILDLLGSGGFGRVWLAKDLTVKGRDVAIKELADPTPERIEGFLREMEILAALKHPGIVTFHHALNKGQYLVMEYIPEGSLRRRFGDQAGMTKGMKAETAVFIVSSLCDVLAAVHERRVVHRDLKPDNIFVQGKTVRVGDFGIAEVMQTGREFLRSGTLSYMAPELFKKDLGKVDHRTDLYAAGIILSELLTGSLPFQASDAGQLIYKIIFDPPPIPRSVPNWLRVLLQKALAKAPDLRFQSAEEFKQALDSRSVPRLYPTALLKANRANVAAEALLARGKISASLSHVEQGLQYYPEHPRLILTQARGLLVMRRAKEALPLLLRCRQLDPGIQCEKELGYAHIENGEHGKAISCLTEYTRRQPDDLKAFNLLMEALYLAGHYEQVVELGAVLSGADPVFLNNGALAAVLAAGGKGAPRTFREATKRQRQSPGYVNYNDTVLQNAASFDLARLKTVLFFAPHTVTVAPMRSTKVKPKPLSVELITRDGCTTIHSFESCLVSCGRMKGLDLEIMQDPHVSRFHGLFYYRDGLYHYRDLQSTYGSYLGEQRVEGDVPLMGVEAITVGESLLKVSY